MGKWFGTGWKIFKAGEHAHFGWVLLEAVLDVRGWLVTLGVWAVTFFGASLDIFRSPLNVWLVSLLAAACAAILYIAWCFFRLGYRTKGAEALPSVDKPTHLFADAVPDLRVADAPSAIKLFEGKEQDKLFPLLEAERLTAWARPMYSGLPPGSGSAPLARLPGSTWATHVLFCLPSSGPGAINQTFIKTKGRLESKWYDIHLNRKQIAAIWPNEEPNEPELFSVSIDVSARRVGDFPVVCALTLTNVSGQSQDVLVKMEQFTGGMPDNMPRPSVLRTENQILEPRSGPFRLRPNEPKTIPMLYRDPIRAPDWSFLDEHGRRHATPASPFKMIIGIYCDTASRKYEIVCDTDAGWKLHSPTISRVANDHVLTDRWGYLR